MSSAGPKRLRDLMPLSVKICLVDWIHGRLYVALRSFFTKLAFSFQYFMRMFSDVHYQIENRGRDRITEERMEYMLKHPDKYSDRDLDSQIPVNQRVSGQILPLLERILDRDNLRLVVEIGCANGSIISALASKYPTINFLGIDLHVAPYLEASKRENLKFMGGYALDIFENGQIPGVPNVVYFQFTATKFLPREIVRYFQAFRRLGVRYIVLNEPTRQGFPIRLERQTDRQTDRQTSLYLGDTMWKHDYPGLAQGMGYEILEFHSDHWSKLIEPRFNRVRLDTYLVRMSARLGR
jgi:hypothetical protein